jgi:hypothetical protein
VSDFSIETPDLVVPDANGYYGSDAHVCDLQLAVEMNGKRVLELEKELDSANLVIAKFSKNIIDYDDIDQYSHQAVHRWEELKWFADDISNKAKALKDQG